MIRRWQTRFPFPLPQYMWCIARRSIWRGFWNGGAQARGQPQMVRNCDARVPTQVRIRQWRGDRRGQSETACGDVRLVQRCRRHLPGVSHEQAPLDLCASFRAPMISYSFLWTWALRQRKTSAKGNKIVQQAISHETSFSSFYTLLFFDRMQHYYNSKTLSC